MIYESQIIKYQVNEHHFDKVAFHAKKRILQLHTGEANLYSAVHKDGETRMAAAPIDRTIGVIGEYAINVYMRGKIEGFLKFDEFRTEMNGKPAGDDGGSDVPGFPIDIKTSAMRSTRLKTLDYHLPIPPKDRRDGNVFVLGLVDKGYLDIENRKMIVDIIGWAHDKEFTQYRSTGVFEGKYVIKARELHPMIEFPYDSHWVQNHKRQGVPPI
jgi:hypothetical protein